MPKQIPLAGGRAYAIVDDADYEYLNQWTWNMTPAGYAIRQGTEKRVIDGQVWRRYYCITMHRFLLNPPNEVLVDHINQNKADNRRSNLRLCTKSQNHMNRTRRKPDGSSSAYKGVAYMPHLKKYRARLNRKHIGVYLTEKEAAIAYNEAAAREYGEFACFNVIVD